jgi:hypothetical protein
MFLLILYLFLLPIHVIYCHASRIARTMRRAGVQLTQYHSPDYVELRRSPGAGQTSSARRTDLYSIDNATSSVKAGKLAYGAP